MAKKEAAGAEPDLGITRARGNQVRAHRARGGNRFDRARKQLFLEVLASTANVRLAAQKAGISYGTAFAHRGRDAAFATAWAEAMRQACALLEADMLAIALAQTPYELKGDRECEPAERMDQATRLRVLDAQHRNQSGSARKPGANATSVAHDELCAALAKRLHLFGIRVRAEIAVQEGASHQAEPA